jgi:hypothetical protein
MQSANGWSCVTDSQPDDIVVLTLRGANVKSKSLLVAVVTWLAMMSATRALAAPRQIEDFCFKQAQRVTYYSRGAYEAFMANCIANLTPTPTERRKYRKY